MAPANAEDASRRRQERCALTGATLQGWFAPDITDDPRKGICGWSRDDLVQYLKTGVNKRTLVSRPMGEAVSHSTSRMNDEDILAIATYLKDSDESGASARQSQLLPPISRCARVRRPTRTVVPPAQGLGRGGCEFLSKMAGSALVQSDDPTTLVRVVLHGTRAVSTAGAPTAPAMPAFDWRLEDAQVAAVLTYIRNNWGNAAGPVPAGAVTSQRASPANT